MTTKVKTIEIDGVTVPLKSSDKPCKKPCEIGKICNISSGRCVAKEGVAGKTARDLIADRLKGGKKSSVEKPTEAKPAEKKETKPAEKKYQVKR